MRPFSSKTSVSSKRTSVSSTRSQAPSRLSISSNSSGVSYFLQFPFAASQPQTQRQIQRQSVQSVASTTTDVAEMLDDDNMAWGKPKKSARR